jgi:hypothetical protein
MEQSPIRPQVPKTILKYDQQEDNDLDVETEMSNFVSWSGDYSGDGGWVGVNSATWLWLWCKQWNASISVRKWNDNHKIETNKERGQFDSG